MARKKKALLVDVLGDAGVERAYGIWSFEFRELPAFCGMVGKLKLGDWQRLFSGDSSGPSLRAM
jgi:hypothetical protein